MDLGITLGIIGIIIGLVALAVAIPPFVQMIWGKTELQVDFVQSAEQGAKVLMARIINKPIKNKFLRVLGVTRTPAKVFALFDIREHGHNQFVASVFRAKLIDAKSHEEGITLTAEAPLPLLFVIAEHTDSGARTVNFAPPKDTELRLSQGEYFVEVRVGFPGGVIGAAQSFSIAANKDATDWTWRKIPR